MCISSTSLMTSRLHFRELSLSNTDSIVIFLSLNPKCSQIAIRCNALSLEKAHTKSLLDFDFFLDVSKDISFISFSGPLF